MAVMEATDRDRLAESFCRAMAVVSGAETVLLAEVDGDSVHELARHVPAGGPSRLSVERMARTLVPGSPTSVTWHKMTEADESDRYTVTVIDLPSGSARTVALIDGDVDHDRRESVLLLIDIAAATAERIDSEERLRAQEVRLRALSEQIKALGNVVPEESRHRAAEFASTAALLTERERDILEELLRGASNASIAESHTLSIETVKTHVKHILRKMGASNRAELIARSG